MANSHHGDTGRRKSPYLIAFSLPLPISKNDRVQVHHRKVLTLEGGRPVQRVKALVHNSDAWSKYANNAILLMLEQGIPRKYPHPAQDERIEISCRWFLKNDRTDCVNFHDLLADTIKKAIDVDDRWFLIKDLWSKVDEQDPHVWVSMTTIGEPP